MSHYDGPSNISVGDLLRYRFPVTAIASILHRITGVLLFIAIPFVLWSLDCALASAHGFAYLSRSLSSHLGHVLVWLFLSCVSYHVLAGVKHLIMDLGLGETLCASRWMSWLVIVLQIVVMVMLGVWLWVW